jgi:hypothetical protein
VLLPFPFSPNASLLRLRIGPGRRSKSGFRSSGNKGVSKEALKAALAASRSSAVIRGFRASGNTAALEVVTG